MATRGRALAVEAHRAVEPRSAKLGLVMVEGGTKAKVTYEQRTHYISQQKPGTQEPHGAGKAT